MEICDNVRGIYKLLFTSENQEYACDFKDERGVFLRLTSVQSQPHQIYQTVVDGEPIVEKRLTANGEVEEIVNSRRMPARMARRVALEFACDSDELLTGLGQHEDGVYQYQGKKEYLYQNNMIISLPFLLSSAGYGVLIDAECAMRFESDEPGKFRFILEAVDDFGLTVLRGRDAAEVVRMLSAQNGATPLLPRWAYGYMQSRERYKTAEELAETVRRFRRENLGLDCIILDWRTWQGNHWGDKTPDPERFPSVPAMMDALHALHAHLIVSVWPNMAKGGQDHAEFEVAHQFLPNCDTYDAFNPDARRLYAEQCERFWGSGGVDGFWCDSSEPFTDPDWNGAQKRPEETRYRLINDAAARSIDETRINAYALYHAQSIYEYWRAQHSNRRLVNLTRSGYTGVAKYGTILWSGDICARWDVLRAQIAEALKMAMCGISHWTLDCGGFFVVRDAYDRRGCDCATETPNPLWFWRGDYNDGVKDPAYRELYVRWLQFACFLPVFRSHGTDTPREPWQFGAPGSLEYDTIQAFIALRYRLLPYVYAAAAEMHFEGTPMLRSMLMAFGQDARARMLCDSYLFGSALLVKPVTAALGSGGDTTDVYLPEGAGWYDWDSHEFFEGGQTAHVQTPLSKLPLFARAGAVIPLSMGGVCAEQLSALCDELLVFTGADGEGWIYGDAGDGYAYEQGAYTRIRVRWSEKDHVLTLEDALGHAGLETQIAVRLIAPNGKETVFHADYRGKQLKIKESFESGGRNQ